MKLIAFKKLSKEINKVKIYYVTSWLWVYKVKMSSRMCRNLITHFPFITKCNDFMGMITKCSYCVYVSLFLITRAEVHGPTKDV